MNEQALRAMLLGFVCVAGPFMLGSLCAQWKRAREHEARLREFHRREAETHAREHAAWMREFNRAADEAKRINEARRREHEAWYRAQAARKAKRESEEA